MQHLCHTCQPKPHIFVYLTLTCTTCFCNVRLKLVTTATIWIWRIHIYHLLYIVLMCLLLQYCTATFFTQLLHIGRYSIPWWTLGTQPICRLRMPTRLICPMSTSSYYTLTPTILLPALSLLFTRHNSLVVSYFTYTFPSKYKCTIPVNIPLQILLCTEKLWRPIYL